jgi:PadR family transcriptional regulator PadR
MPKRIIPDTGTRSGELIPGTLDALILKAVSRGKMHGYAIADWIHSISEETLEVEEGALYPALHRLEVRGMLDSEWGTSDTNRRVKFYILTSAGKKHLAAERRHWGRMTAGVMRVLESS